jgi:hypothetical protein
MLARIARRLAAPTGLMAVRAPGQELPPVTARLVEEDHVEGEGLVEGLAAGLAAVTSPLAFVVSGDVPFVSVPVVGGLLALANDYDVVVPRWERRIHPLCTPSTASLWPRCSTTRSQCRRPVDPFERCAHASSPRASCSRLNLAKSRHSLAFVPARVEDNLIDPMDPIPSRPHLKSWQDAGNRHLDKEPRHEPRQGATP